MALADNNFPNNHKLYSEKGVSGDLPLHFSLERSQESYVTEMQEFVDALNMDGEMPVGGQDGLMSILIGLAARKSAKENRPVKITEVNNKFLNLVLDPSIVR
jgi:myo-inositol 2-dehydrogenase/D-chiro-inositol 1-dehydrogenase